ncbi:IclR family transcriptional regulator [Cupriavidus numazuensis]|uniref:HTH-type transcriptional regulator TsaQ1/TsaQ2 n=1 Tax=Cupriavidus numazuensis TaxID=221992 RepID=A0ABN7Q1Y1_9BURK|nr:helix-turn-helix domain-containing protein [Cupriavidus numazuensis]CAG2153714.1 HTH-type transcriptional regulator TsaQ1/TsaQ2 [Cupriavidus numazuensis]
MPDDSPDIRIVPLARALAVLGAFTADRHWMTNRDLAALTGIPVPTVARIVQSLVSLAYLHRDPIHKKCRLAAGALSLGYAAIMPTDMVSTARVPMQAFAEATDTCVVLGARDKLDVTVLDAQVGAHALLDPGLSAGVRMPLCAGPMGWALLAALPESERFYLLGNVERKSGNDWPSRRRRIAAGISQLHNAGYCVSAIIDKPGLVLLAVPVCVPGLPPVALACIGRSARMARSRIERELAPRLIAMAEALRERWEA